MARNLFDQIDFALAINAPRRNGHIPAVWRLTQREAEAFENAAHVRVGHFRAEQPLDLAFPQAHRRRLRAGRIAIHEGAARLARADLLQERAGPLHRRDWQPRIRAPLEAYARLGLQPELLAGPPH